MLFGDEVCQGDSSAMIWFLAEDVTRNREQEV